MTAADTMTETIRIRIEPEKKDALTRLYREHGTTVSQVARDFFDKELESSSNPLDRFDAITASVDAKLDAYDAPEPTIEDIVDFVEAFRAKRSEDAAVHA